MDIVLTAGANGMHLHMMRKRKGHNPVCQVLKVNKVNDGYHIESIQKTPMLLPSAIVCKERMSFPVPSETLRCFSVTEDEDAFVICGAGASGLAVFQTIEKKCIQEVLIALRGKILKEPKVPSGKVLGRPRKDGGKPPGPKLDEMGVPVVKRKQGRPRKDAGQPVQKKRPMIEDSDEEETTDVVEPVKKKRGRPRKEAGQPVQKKRPIIEDSDEEETTKMVEPVKKKQGQPRKDASKTVHKKRAVVQDSDSESEDLQPVKQDSDSDEYEDVQLAKKKHEEDSDESENSTHGGGLNIEEVLI